MAIGRQAAKARHCHDGARQGIDETGASAEPHLVDGDFKIRRYSLEGGIMADGERRLGHADGQVIPVTPITIIEKETVFGTDPVQCTQIMDDPSISSVQARLRQTDDAGFLLQDNNSIAGTWVNYEPIPREGHRLAHGDMVHFGQLIYRFTLTVPPVVSNPKITVQNTDE
mgnify:CR=1 FL=1